VEISPDAAVLRTQLALSWLREVKTKSAITQLETAVGLDDKLTQSDALLILLRLKEGDLDEAAAAATCPNAARAEGSIGFNLLGVVSLAKKDDAAAVAAFEKAMAVDPGFSPAALNLSKMALGKGRSRRRSGAAEEFARARSGRTLLR
jgi:Tfp pilus assembly protein PilF